MIILFSNSHSGSDAALDAWSAVGDATLTVVADDTPVSSALPNSVQVVVPEGASGPVGLANEGYFGTLYISADVTLPYVPAGIKVEEGTTYNASFYYRFPSAADFAGTITATLQSASGDALASSSVDVFGDASAWQKAELFLTADATPDSVDNLFTVTLDGAEASGVTANFALFSLFPPTFKNRPNGMRADIAQV
jgi:alpha-L-arabinofuranosidase